MFSRKKAAAGIASAALMFSLLLTGCGTDPKTALITASSGETIDFGYGNFVAKYSQAMYDIYYGGSSGGTAMWETKVSEDGTTLEESVKSHVLDQMEEQWLLRQHAGDYSVTLTDEDNKKIDEYTAKFFSDNDEDGVKKMGATEQYVKDYFTNNAYAIKVQDKIYEEADTDFSAAETEQSSISYVKFEIETVTGADGASAVLSEDQKAEAKKNAEELAKAAPADYETKAAELSGEVKTFSYTKADTSYEGMVLPENVILEAKKLNEGAITGVVEASDGYYVCRMDKLVDADATDNKKKTLESSAKTTHYNEVIEGFKAETTFTVNDNAWKSVSLTDVLFTEKAKPEAAETEENSTSAETSATSN